VRWPRSVRLCFTGRPDGVAWLITRPFVSALTLCHDPAQSRNARP
jgi:hypothetical protein